MLEELPCFNLADSQTTGLLLLPAPLAERAGLDRPLEVMLSPGLAHPPPGTGEGLRDSDIGVLGVPVVKGRK